jgi:CheY-like chemotaxis protein
MNKKILFIDGDPSALELYPQILQDEFEIATAVSGEKGLLVLRNDGSYATVIADMQMPGMDGVQFLERAQPGSEHHASVDPGKDGYRLPGQCRQRRVYLPLAGEIAPASRAEKGQPSRPSRLAWQEIHPDLFGAPTARQTKTRLQL